MDNNDLKNKLQNLVSEIGNHLSEEHDGSFGEQLSEITFPKIDSISSWNEFKQKIVKKDLALYFWYNTDNLKKYAATAYSKNNLLVILKFVLQVGVLVTIIYTKSYFNLWLLGITAVGVYCLSHIKLDRKVTTVLLLIPILAMTYFFGFNQIYSSILYLTLVITAYIYQNHDDALLRYALGNQYNFLQLFEEKIIPKIYDVKAKTFHMYLSEAMKSSLNSRFKKINADNGTDIKF